VTRLQTIQLWLIFRVYEHTADAPLRSWRGRLFFCAMRRAERMAVCE
jgi:hypothetical protein